MQKRVTFYLSEKLIYVLDAYQQAYDLSSRTEALRQLIRSLELKITTVKGEVKTVEAKGSPFIDVEKFKEMPQPQLTPLEKAAPKTLEPEKGLQAEIFKTNTNTPPPTPEKEEKPKENLATSFSNESITTHKDPRELRRCPHRKGSLVRVALVCETCKQTDSLRYHSCMSMSEAELEAIAKP